MKFLRGSWGSGGAERKTLVRYDFTGSSMKSTCSGLSVKESPPRFCVTTDDGNECFNFIRRPRQLGVSAPRTITFGDLGHARNPPRLSNSPRHPPPPRHRRPFYGSRSFDTAAVIVHLRLMRVDARKTAPLSPTQSRKGYGLSRVSSPSVLSVEPGEVWRGPTVELTGPLRSTIPGPDRSRSECKWGRGTF